MLTTMPTFDQVRALPLMLERQVHTDHEDANGHMSVTGHLALHEEAAWPWLQGLELDPSVSEGRWGLMDLEHHLRYLAEVHVDDLVAVHGRLLERAERRLHGLWFLVNITRQQIADTFEFVSVHVDLERRRAAPFGETAAAALDQQILTADHDWHAPVSGSMGLH